MVILRQRGMAHLVFSPATLYHKDAEYLTRSRANTTHLYVIGREV